MKKNETSIVKSGEMNQIQKKKFGSSLVDAAEAKNSQMKSDALVHATALIIQQIEDAETSLKWCKAVVAFLKKKLKALEAGEFSYDPNQNFIRFTEKDLNNTQPESERPGQAGGLGGRL